MKYILVIIFASALLVSCGQEIERGGKGAQNEVEKLIGEIKALEAGELLTAKEAGILLKACGDLQRKRALFGDIANFGRTIEYVAGVKTCGSENEIATESISTKIGLDGARFTYKNENLPYNFVVTDTDNIMGEVCEHVRAAAAEESPSLPGRVLNRGGDADPVWIYAYGEGDSQCGNTDEISCVFLQTGIPTASGGNFRIRDVKGYAIVGEAENPYRGFVSDRFEATLCLEDESQKTVRQMILKTLKD